MPIACITGTPGAGKTLSALQELFKELGISTAGKTPQELGEEVRNRASRPVYVCNVRGLKPGIFEEIADPFGWEDLPDGSLILVDEAWEYYGKHLRNSDDARVLNLAKHRHRGFDFIFTTQAPGQLAPFVRDLLGRHVHVTRKFGTQTTIRYEWPHVQDNPNSQTAKGQAIEQIWTYPKEIFDLYESATLHTVKRKIPRKIIMAALVGVLALGAIPAGGYALYAALWPEQAVEEASASPIEARSGASTEEAGEGRSDAPLTVDEYIEQRTPRLELDPASAPLYDRFEVRDYPRVFCMISGDQRVERISCRCRTQQMTPVNMSERACVYVARNGMWDPRRAPEPDAPPVEDRQTVEAPSEVVEASPGPVGVGKGINRAVSQPYSPPDFVAVGS